MSLRKYATTEILSATMAPTGAAALARYAHRHQFNYDPRPGYLYVRSRAISSRTNDNFDTFPAAEIEKSYASFVGKPVFVNHNNDNHHRARGVVIDAALHKDANPDGSPDTWVEVLMEVDAVRFPKLAQAIVEGHIDRTSMGTDVAYSLCSFCGNKATTPLEYCAHIPKMKGQRIYRATASGKKEGVLVSEICHGLKFFENSLLVEEPADPTAYFLGVEGHGMKTASREVPAEVTQAAKDTFSRRKEAISIDPEEVRRIRDWADDQHQTHQMHQKLPADLNNHADLISHLTGAHQESDWVHHAPLDELQAYHDEDHATDMSEGHENAEWPDAVNMGGHHFHEARRLPAGKPVSPRPIRPRHAGRVNDFMDLHVRAPKGPRLGPASGPDDHSKMLPTTCTDCGFQHWNHPSDLTCMLCGGHTTVEADENKHTAARVYAYGEQMAPADVDTLRDEECPVCGEADAYDGNECQVCGFVAPPKMFMDPDLDVAKQMDLRGDMQNEMQSDPNGDGMPDVIPGSGNPGTDAPPMDPEQVPDPDDVAQQQVNQITDEQDPLQPEELDENGQPIMQQDPLAQEVPQDPNAEPMAPEDIAGDDGQGAPGTPGDGVADLGCPACGFSTDATAPQSVDMDTPQAAPGEVAEGALCPQCGQSPLVSLKQVEEQAAAQGLPVAASLFPVIRL